MGTLSLQCVLLLSAVGSQPIMAVPCDHVDLVEVNHLHDDHGRLLFDQVLYYEWSEELGRHQVQAWRLLKTSAQKPQHDFQTGDYIAIWHDGETLREVRSKAIRETWTQYDPELIAREFLPKNKRKELAKVNISRSPRKTTPEPTVPSREVARN